LSPPLPCANFLALAACVHARTLHCRDRIARDDSSAVRVSAGQVGVKDFYTPAAADAGGTLLVAW
jgi:hypothetical protein